ncbi:MAG TPA: hypothetical protein VF384_18035 [Planctomycetota bacterium]
MKLHALACLAVAALARLPAQDPAFRLVPRPPEAPTPAGPAWLESFAAAEAAAKQRHTDLLLFFTAKW